MLALHDATTAGRNSKKSDYSLTQRMFSVDLKRKVLKCQYKACAKFETFHTIINISRAPKCRLLTFEILSAMDDCLRNDDELTANKLYTKLLEQCANFPDVSLSMIKG